MLEIMTNLYGDIFHNFVNRFFEEIKEAFNQHEFWGNTWLE